MNEDQDNNARRDDNARRNDELTIWQNLRILNKNPAWSASCYWYLR